MDLQFGFFGKLPSQGDFVSRRLPWEFSEVWDDWMQQGMALARQQLGERWLACYLSAPVWRFQLGPGVAGASGWLGLWFPSVDRVGRHYPLTVAAALPADALAYCWVTEDDAQWVALEDQVLTALDPRTSLDEFDERVRQVKLRLEPPGCADLAAAEAVQGLQVQTLPVNTEATSARRACAGTGGTPALFFSWGSDALPVAVVRSPDLLDAPSFCGFLTGQWPVPAST